ncbi:MAG TPA: aldehyde dehydrogenase family protein, partial [Magnetospirillaceae bacterium]|nr:aldehyde dehydrogenase family protein [Magnetospirillaceae bacterium]
MHVDVHPFLRQQAYIGGEWVDAGSGKTFAVNNPATGELLAMVADCGVEDAQRAIDAAAQAQPGWAARTAKERAAILKRWFDLMMANQDELAALMTAEQGKPLAEAKGEIAYGASFIEWFAEEGKRVYGDVIPTYAKDRRILVLKQPVGVCASITPWNFPNAMIARKAGPALAAGCALVARPAELTPLSAL